MPSKVVTVGNRPLTLDARPDRLDLRDRAFVPRLGNLPDRFPSDETVKKGLPAYTKAGLILDQGTEGACTGFGLAAVINFLLFSQRERQGGGATHRVSPAMLYRLARLYDEWPGEDYDGSSCRGALKGWHRHGVCREALWSSKGPPKESAQDRSIPADNWDVDALGCTLGVYYRIDARSIVDMQAALCETGAIYVSATVHEGWDIASTSRAPSHETLATITHVPKPKDAGGHAFTIVGFNDLGFVVQNSWGPEWGSGGFALLPYEDWVIHGDDAWAFTLGVSRQRALAAGTGKQKAGGTSTVLRSPRFLVPSQETNDKRLVERTVGLLGASDGLARRCVALPEKHRPLDTDAAYRHALVLDRGFPVSNDVTIENATAAVRSVAFDRPRAWRASTGKAEPLKVMIYAHGGLNSESDSIQRVRMIAPYALGAGVYPLFVTWRSGPLETASDLVEETLARFGFGARGVQPARGWLDKIIERTDRLLEPVLRAPGGAMWQQMKLNAERASAHAQGGCRLMAEGLAALHNEAPIELHLVGHSAGSIIVGSLMKQLQQHRIPVASLHLYAPACTTRFALENFVPAVEAGTLRREDWFIHVLSDANERGDSVGPYRKSLLYLVSRSFEDDHKTPLLGLDKSFDPKSIDDDMWAASHTDDVRQWIDFWWSHPASADNRIVLGSRSVSNGVGTIDSSHGCFDNAVDIVGRTLSLVAKSDVKVRRLDY